jgi:uncharacterized protein YecE (DUF72 family)
LIGCGGFQYFKAPGDPLINYAKIFDFVEINSSFYNIPELETCKKWKNKVKFNKNFEFSVKAYQDITHKNSLKPIKENIGLVDRMKNICDVLNSNILVFQTPYELELNVSKLKEIDEFFNQILSKNIQYVWEIRSLKQIESSNLEKLREMLMEYNIIHCVDYSKESPIYYNSNLEYTRIFGLGEGNKYQFDDKEIKDLQKKFIQTNTNTKKLVVSFHTQRMVHDAARSKQYNDTGKFMNITGKYGLQSFLGAIEEYEKYPTTKNQLIVNHGWKIYDKNNYKREKMIDILKNIQNKTYKNRDELVKEIKKIDPFN